MAWEGFLEEKLAEWHADLLKTVHDFLLSWDEKGATQLCH